MTADQLPEPTTDLERRVLAALHVWLHCSDMRVAYDLWMIVQDGLAGKLRFVRGGTLLFHVFCRQPKLYGLLQPYIRMTGPTLLKLQAAWAKIPEGA